VAKKLPAHLQNDPWLHSRYGTPEHDVREVSDGQLGWYQADPTELAAPGSHDKARRYRRPWAAGTRCWRPPGKPSPTRTTGGQTTPADALLCLVLVPFTYFLFDYADRAGRDRSLASPLTPPGREDARTRCDGGGGVQE
jgi:hypothetical protein